MNVEDLLADTFADHEGLAPDPDVVWAGVQRDLRGHRPFVRPLAAAASVLVVAGAATGIAVLTGRDAQHRAASPAASRTALSSATTPAPPPASSKITPLAMPFDLGWLPAGRIDYVARRVNAGGPVHSDRVDFNGEYLLTAHPAGEPLDIDVQQMSGGLSGTRFKCGGNASVTIGGRPGIESAKAGGACGYEVYFRDAAGGLMYVNVARPRSQPGPAQRLTSIGRRIAASIRFPGTSTVRPGFGVGYLPGGLRIRQFDVGAVATSYGLGRAGTLPTVYLGTNVEPGFAPGKPGRAVQGHPTRLGDDHGYHLLTVFGAVHGQRVLLQGKVPAAELYRIADGLVLP